MILNHARHGFGASPTQGAQSAAIRKCVDGSAGAFIHLSFPSPGGEENLRHQPAIKADRFVLAGNVVISEDRWNVHRKSLS